MPLYKTEYAIENESIIVASQRRRYDVLPQYRDATPRASLPCIMKNLSLPANISPQQLSIVLKPVQATDNPTRCQHPVYDWLIRSKLYGSSIRQLVRQHLHINPEQAVWCFNRMGQSRTIMADGTQIYIGGEHEDFYDPDFRIYNDAVIVYPDQSTELFQYTEQDFPPTDFHSASLHADEKHIILVGCNGHPEQRDLSTTQVATFNVITAQVQLIKTSGQAPAWLHQHEAKWIDTDILEVSSGNVLLAVPEFSYPLFIRNLYRWQLDTISWYWSRPQQAHYHHWYVYRQDQHGLCLFDMRCLIWDRRHHRDATPAAEQRLIDRLGFIPSTDVYQALYQPDYPHQPGPLNPAQAAKHDEHYIQVNGCQVLYIEEFEHIQVIADRAINHATMQLLLQDLSNKLQALHGVPISRIDLNQVKT